MPTSQDIKDTIRDFVNFDVEKNYYQKEDKEELVRQFKKILYEDDITVRKFLKSFFEETKKIAEEYSLIAKEENVEEIPVEEPTETETEEEPSEENLENTEEEKTQESFFVKVASNILYE